MRLRRIKLPGILSSYHCTSRCVGQQFLFGRAEKDFIEDLLFRSAHYCGVHVLDYVIMSNHYHVVVEVQEPRLLSREEMISRYRHLYGEKSLRTSGLLKAFERDDERAEREQQRIHKNMYDLSVFQQVFKQCISRWYNRRNDRKGALWSERFKSPLIDQLMEVRARVGAYVALNPVRAGIVDDPKRYKWSAFSRALRGCKLARKGICQLMGVDSWLKARRLYQRRLVLSSEIGREQGKRGLPEHVIKQMQRYDGGFEIAFLLLQRVRYMVDGLIIGSKSFVEAHWERIREHLGPNRKSGARRLRGGDWDGIYTLRDLRVDAITPPKVVQVPEK